MIFYALSAGPRGRCWNPSLKGEGRGPADVNVSEKHVWSLLLHKFFFRQFKLWRNYFKKFFLPVPLMARKSMLPVHLLKTALPGQRLTSSLPCTLLMMMSVFMPRHQKGGVLCYTLRNFECPSVGPSVCPSVSAHHHSCIGNSSYSLRPILLKLYRCFKDGLKIGILFFQNPEIIFYHFFPIFNLDIFRALILQICIWSMYLVSATPPTVFGESFWNFTGVLRMVWRYAYCFFRILKLFFITFFAFLT